MDNLGTLDTCLACGCPFTPSNDAIAARYNKTAVRIMQYNQEYERNETLVNTIMKKSKTPHFCNVKEMGHLLHRSSHTEAVRFMMQQELTNNTQVEMKFINKNNKRDKNMWAVWTVNEQQKIPSRLLHEHLLDPRNFNRLQTHLAINTNTTVAVCRDCNVVMTMLFWFRYHLYTGMDINPERLIPTDRIAIHRDNANNVGNIIQQYPKDEFHRGSDMFTPCIAYFLNLCQPRFSPGYNALHDMHKQALTKLNVMLSWLTMEILCLYCEYYRGTEDKGLMPCSPKCLIGVIEMYISYWCWNLAAFKFRNLHARLTFEEWHRFYVWDMSGNPTFRDSNAMSLFHEVRLRNFNRPSIDAFKNLADKLFRCYEIHFRLLPLMIINDPMLLTSPNLSQESKALIARLQEHYIETTEIDTVLAMYRNSEFEHFNYMVRALGARAMWTRAFYLHVIAQSYPAYLIREMQRMIYDGIKHELKNVVRRLDPTAISERKEMVWRQARIEYERCLLSRSNGALQKGMWKTCIALSRIGAFQYKDRIPPAALAIEM